MDNSNYIETWGKIKDQGDDVLKKVAKDLYNNLIFCDRQCGGTSVGMVFMIMMMIGPESPTKPTAPTGNGNIVDDRDELTEYFINEKETIRKYKIEKKLYKKAYKYFNENYISSIGLVYEYMSNAGPMSVNGLPNFFSARFLNIEDTEKMFKFYESYKQKREEVDNF